MKNRSEARRIKAKRAGVPVEDYVEPRRESPSDVQKRARKFMDVLIADARRHAAEQSKTEPEQPTAETEEEERIADKSTVKEETRDGVFEKEPGDSPGQGGTEHSSIGGWEGDEDVRLVLLVSHGGLLHVMLSSVMDLGEEIGFMNNCAVAMVDVFFEEEEEEDGGGSGSGSGGGGRGRVSYVQRFLNDDSHMEAAGLAPAGRDVENFGRRS